MMQPSSNTGLRPYHGAIVVATVVVAAVVAFAALHFVVGIIWFFVKLFFVIAVLYGITRVVLRHSKS